MTYMKDVHNCNNSGQGNLDNINKKHIRKMPKEDAIINFN